MAWRIATVATGQQEANERFRHYCYATYECDQVYAVGQSRCASQARQQNYDGIECSAVRSARTLAYPCTRMNNKRMK